MNLSNCKKVYLKFLLFFFCAFVSYLSVSCATTGNRAVGRSYPVYITNMKKVYLLPAGCMSGTVDALQLLTGTYGKNSFSIQAYIRANQSGIFVSLLNDFGTDMGKLDYTDGNITFASAVFPSSFKPQYIISDFQNVYYDAGALARYYAESSLAFTAETAADGTELRRICDGENCIEEIRKNGGTVTIVNNLRNYTYQLKEAEE
jgi:hypothetical protein